MGWLADWSPPLQTAFLTVLTATATYILGQLVVEFLIKPYLDVRRAVGEVCQTLQYHAAQYVNPQLPGVDPEADEASRKLVNVAAAYYSRTVQLPCYWLFSFLRLVPSKRLAREAYGNLIFLSNAQKVSDIDSPRKSRFRLLHEDYERVHQILGIALLLDHDVRVGPFGSQQNRS